MPDVPSPCPRCSAAHVVRNGATRGRVTTRGAGNHDPAFTSAPPTTAVVGRPLTYPSMAADPDGDGLTHALVQGPAGLAVDPATGAVT